MVNIIGVLVLVNYMSDNYLPRKRWVGFMMGMVIMSYAPYVPN